MSNGHHRTRPHPRLGWLAAIVPAAARRFRVRDPEFAAAISAVGGELVQSSPDVEIANADELRADATVGIIPVEVRPPGVARRRPLRAVRRLVDAALVRSRIAVARRTALRHGYTRAIPVAWEAQTKLVTSLDGPPDRVPLFQRFPRRVVVVCRRGLREPTALEAALSEASRELGRELGMPTFVLGSSGALIAPAQDVVLRVSLGPVARRMEDQSAALELLREAHLGALVADRVPWVLASGSIGLGRWSAEQRLPGRPVEGGVEEIAGDCLDFLTELFRAGSEARLASPAQDAEICAEHFPGQAETLRDLGSRLEIALARMPRGFGHGDFWAGNLLVEDGQLAGVVDWPSAGPGRLPLLDVLHLRATQVRERTGKRLAPIVIEYLIPQARAGGHELDRDYCRRLDLELKPGDLVNLVGAYWLEELRHALIDPDRDPGEPERPGWRSANVETLRALVGSM